MELTVVKSWTKKAGKVNLCCGLLGMYIEVSDCYVLLEADVPISDTVLEKWKRIAAIKNVERKAPKTVLVVITGKMNVADFFGANAKDDLPQTVAAYLAGISTG